MAAGRRLTAEAAETGRRPGTPLSSDVVASIVLYAAACGHVAR